MRWDDGEGQTKRPKDKTIFVYDFLMRNSNAEYPVKTERILEYLEELGIGTERRSVYKDIEEMNQMLLVLKGCAEDSK